jgi:hypothetical protein
VTGCIKDKHKKQLSKILKKKSSTMKKKKQWKKNSNQLGIGITTHKEK